MEITTSRLFNRELLLRTVTSLVGAIVFVLALTTTVWTWFLFVAVVCTICNIEAGLIYQKLGKSPPWLSITALPITLVFAPLTPAPWAILMLAAAILTYALSVIPTGKHRGEGEVLWRSLFLTSCLSSLAWMRLAQSGVDYIVFLLVVVWSFDIFCYIGGKLFGKTKLAPSISKGKTWEGLLSGLLLASLTLIGTTRLPGIPDTLWLVPAVWLICLAALAGDLYESVLKRHANVKDASSILPGHGGFLDRFDGLAFSPLVAYVLLSLLNG